MPIEIRELIIKATITQEGGQGGTSSMTGTNNEMTLNEEIINSCVEKILEILKEKNER